MTTLGDKSAVHVFAPGSVNEFRVLKDSCCGDFLTIGTVKGREYLFVPYDSGNTITLYDHLKKHPYAVLNTVSGPRGIAIKPPGVP